MQNAQTLDTADPLTPLRDAFFIPDAGIRKFLCGTRPILSLRALEAGLDVISGLDMAVVRAKSQSLTALFIELVEAKMPSLTLTLASRCRCAGITGFV